MKIRTLISGFFAAVLCQLSAISCSEKGEIAERPSADSTKRLQMSFSVGLSSKSTIDGWNVQWEAGDCISVFDGTFNNRFTTDDSGSTATFNGEALEVATHRLLYPYSADASYSGGVVHTVLTSSQTAVVGSFDPESFISCATCSNGATECSVQNAVALLKFELVCGSAQISAIRFSSTDGTPLSGSVTLDPSSDVPVMEAGIEGACDWVELVPESGNLVKGNYFLSVIPSSLETGLTVTIKYKSGSETESIYSSEYTFVRNRITDIGTISVIEEEQDDISADPASSYAAYGVDFSKLASHGHPRLFMNSADFYKLKSDLASYESNAEVQYKVHSDIISLADTYLSEAVPVYDLSSGTLLTQSRLALSHIFYTAYAYRMTGDTKYLSKARTDLKAVCAFQDWNAAGQMLDPAEMGLAVAIAYDWLYYDLSLSERTAAHNALKTFFLSAFNSYEAPTATNWNQVCNGGAIAAALVLYEKDKTLCATAIDKAIASNLTGADYTYNPNGNGIEGYGYWDYAMAYQQVIITALENSFGTSCSLADMEGMKKAGEWLLYVDGQKGPFNYSDVSSEKSTPKHMMLWLASRYQRPELAVREKLFLQNASYSGHRLLPLSMAAFVRWPIDLGGSSSFPKGALWYASGDPSPIVLVRQGWTYGETDRFFGFKGCGGSNNHSHMDAGSFVYDDRGVRWACDIYFGNYTAYRKYITSLFSLSQTAKRWDILSLNNYYHNTLSFTWADGSVAKTHITDQVVGPNINVERTFDSTSEGIGGTIDISPYYSDAAASVKRTVKIKDGTLYVTDEITAKPEHSADFQWRMVTKTTPSGEAECIKLTSSDKSVAYLQAAASGDVASYPSYSTSMVYRPSEWGAAKAWDSIDDLSKYKVAIWSASVEAGGSATFTTTITSNKPKSL